MVALLLGHRPLTQWTLLLQMRRPLVAVQGWIPTPSTPSCVSCLTLQRDLEWFQAKPPVSSRNPGWEVLQLPQAQVVVRQVVVGLFVAKTYGAVSVQLEWAPSAPHLPMHPDSLGVAVCASLVSRRLLAM